jgi:hypothetical protein
MQAKETLEMIGRLKIEVFGDDGKLKQVADIPNLVVTAGKGFIASRMTAASASVMSHMAVGTGTTSPVAGDTTLETELARVALTSGTTAGAVATYVASFPAGTGTGALTEAGIFNAGSSGTMLCRTTFSVINKGASDSMTITWTVTVS